MHRVTTGNLNTALVIIKNRTNFIVKGVALMMTSTKLLEATMAPRCQGISHSTEPISQTIFQFLIGIQSICLQAKVQIAYT